MHPQLFNSIALFSKTGFICICSKAAISLSPIYRRKSVVKEGSAHIAFWSGSVPTMRAAYGASARTHGAINGGDAWTKNTHYLADLWDGRRACEIRAPVIWVSWEILKAHHIDCR